jgi:acetylglutamate kinase
MTIVVKIGGAALDDPAVVKRLALSIAAMVSDGHRVAVVHGGGAALSRTLRRMGYESQFVQGLRVTDAQTRDVALMVLAGQLNKQLVAAVGNAGQAALGLCGGDLGLFRAHKRRGEGTEDLGYVGEICTVERRWFETLWQNGVVPVIASIALGIDGEYYNVNGDQMATACAIACRAQALVFLTDVPGVKDGDGTVIRWLDVRSISAMVENATVSGGMLPKLEACTRAKQHGIERVRIMPASSVELLPGVFTQRIDSGTEVMQ